MDFRALEELLNYLLDTESTDSLSMKNVKGSNIAINENAKCLHKN